MSKFYLKFRCDMDEQDTAQQLVYSLQKGQDMLTGIVGVENMNKYGEIIKKHLHFHFVTEEKIETIRKRFIRSLDKKKNYSLKLETDVVDTDRFFRYPLKQYDPQTFEYSQFETRFFVPQDFDLKIQQRLAYEEWNKGKSILTEHAVKRDCRLSVYERILEKIDNEGIKFLNTEDVKYYIFDYFMETKIPLQKQKILDMAISISAYQGLISKYDYFK